MRVYNDLPTSIADCLVNQKETWLFFSIFITLLFLLLIQNNIKNDFDENFVLRFRSKRRIWKMQLWKAGIYALLFSLYYTLCTLVFGSLYSQSFINWGHEASAYYVELKIVNSFVSFSQVALTFFIACALSLFCASLLFLLLLWLPGGHILSWIVMLCFLCWDSFFTQYALFAERVSIEYSNWAANDLWQGFLVETVLIILFSVAGFVTSQKKEFLK